MPGCCRLIDSYAFHRCGKLIARLPGYSGLFVDEKYVPLRLRHHYTGAISSDNLNMIIAVCAMLISGASFYVTYLQAGSAERRAQAMTLPVIQCDHGNYDAERDLGAVYFNLKNAGVGPAIVENITLLYGEQRFDTINDFVRGCCASQWQNRGSRITVISWQ